MIQPNKILAVDDEAQILRVYEDMLGEMGLDVHTAQTVDEAVVCLDEGDWSVVLLDQRLRGSSGGDEGLTLIDEAKRRSPESKIIVVTGYASKDTIETTFAAGAYDYIEKTQSFETLLRAKLRNATELARERWRTSLSDDQVSMQLEQAWSVARSATSPARKGRALEDLLELLLMQIPGFVVAAREHSSDEEFDLVVRNKSLDPLWAKESAYFLVECKNWAQPVGPDELDRFIAKLGRRYGRSRLGFFVAASGFTAGVHTTLAAKREQDLLVILIDKQDLDALVTSKDRPKMLEQLHQRAAVAAQR